MNAIGIITPYERAALDFFSTELRYLADGATVPAVLRGFMRAMSPQELIAAAIQEGALLICKADQFVTVIGEPTPRRFDRVLTDVRRFTVETWWGAPELPPHTFFKMRLNGGQQ